MEIDAIQEKLTELLDKAGRLYTFDEPFDKEEFCDAMKDCYEYFFQQRDKSLPFSKEEIELYGMVFAYSQIPSVTYGQNAFTFKVSTFVAYYLADQILEPIDCELKDGVMLMEYEVENEVEEGLVEVEERLVKYNFNSGDFDKDIKFEEEVVW